MACQESCKKAMTQIEKGSQSVQKFVTLSNVLKHFDQTKLQRKIADMHVAFQVGFTACLRDVNEENSKKTCNYPISCLHS